MAILRKDVNVNEIGTWQEVNEYVCSERILKGRERVTQRTSVCLERARAEIKAYELYKDEPRVIQKALFLKTYLEDKSINIWEGELIVGNVASKRRGSPISGDLMASWLDEELGDPVKDPALRAQDTHTITPEERKELEEVIMPYWREHQTFSEYCYDKCSEEVQKKSLCRDYKCEHSPIWADLQFAKDLGHILPNHEKVLTLGFKGIKEEAEWHLKRMERSYNHMSQQKKIDFYKACIITIDAAMDFAMRYAKLATEMAETEADETRKEELLHIAEVMEHISENPARDFWEAIQLTYFIQCILFCEHINVASNFGQLDRYLWPYYEKSVITDKTLTKDMAKELIECFCVKVSEYTSLWNYGTAQVQAGYGMGQQVMLGAQKADGTDGCNELTWLFLDAEEEAGVFQPNTSLAVWDGTDRKVLRKAAEVVRLGRGKPMFVSLERQQKALQVMCPELSIEDIRVLGTNCGCFEPQMQGINMHNGLGTLINMGKILELTLNNGKCLLCGEQMGPETGDPHQFKTIEELQEAYKAQLFEWVRNSVHTVKVAYDAESERQQCPFSSSICDGPLEKGLDISDGGAWYTFFGLTFGAMSDVADSFGVINKLIYEEKSLTWDELLDAMRKDWVGYEALHAKVVNKVPKYGNDDDYADEWEKWSMQITNDCVEWINSQPELLPYYCAQNGGKYVHCFTHVTLHTGMGAATGALPNGHKATTPFYDCVSPGQGLDKNGPTAVLNSIGKLPWDGVCMGGPINMRFSPQMLATDEDIDALADFISAFGSKQVPHLQINVISDKVLRKAMAEPDKYRDIMVRVASYPGYFVDLDETTQLDIIARTEHKEW